METPCLTENGVLPMKNLIFPPFVCLLFLFACFSQGTRGQETVIPDVASTANHLVADVHGTYSTFNLGESDKMPDGPVAGNGDVGLVLSGRTDEIRFNIGKSDFWGVQRGSIAPVGNLRLSVPQLKGATAEVDQNIGPANLSGKFTSGGAELSFKTWVAATKNLVVIELNNSGSEPLDFSSKLFDGLGTNGNEATYGSGDASTWLKVSPDTMNVSIGNRLSMGPRGGFNGQIADLRIYDQALTSPPPDREDSAESGVKALFHWPASGQQGEHGKYAEFNGTDGTGTTVGALLLPQRQFTVSAWVNAQRADKLNFILSTMTSVYGNDMYPFQRGFALNLDGGKISATLNYTTVASTDPFPLNQWVQIMASYDGNALTIYQDGKSVATTSAFPTAADVMGWDKKTIHTGDKSLPFAGCAPEGILLQRVIGADTKEDQQALKFSLAPGAQATLVLPVMTDRNSPAYFTQAQQLAAQADKDSLAKLYQDHEKWWTDFWSRSFIKIPDQKIQDNWYASLYLLACCSKAECPAPGLWGNFITGDRMQWQGDYTLDYNYEAPFWAALPTNHPELADNYETMMLDQIPRGMATAQHDNYQGLYWYCHLIPVPGWSDDYGTFWGQKSGSLFAVVNCVQRWRYDRDPAYAKKIYPLLKGVADFWDNYLVRKDGRYVDLDDSSGENTGHDTNPATTLAFLRLLYPTLIEISQLLNVDDDRRDRWNDILTNLSPLPIVTADKIGAGLDKIDPSVLHGNLFIRNAEEGSNFPDPQYSAWQDQKTHPTDGGHSSAGMNSSQVIFPGWAIGLESPEHDLQAAYNTVLADSEWFDFNDDCTFYPCAAAVGLDPNLILDNMHALLDRATPNFIFHTGGGGIEDFAVVPATISLMFLQSYQQNIHLFPNWPMDQDASFGNLNACGGFLIGSELRQGKVIYVKIQSTAGQDCHLVNPWPGRVRVSSSMKFPATLSEIILDLQTKPGEILVLQAAP
jgi:alpha-L-fucosidase 2